MIKKPVDEAAKLALRERLNKNLVRGGKPGRKTKVTLLREALQNATLVSATNSKVAPLDAILRFMNEQIDIYDDLVAKPVPKKDKDRIEHFRGIRAARNDAANFAIAAAPYCHAKLQSIDKTVKKAVIIQRISFENADPLTVGDEGA